MESLSSCISWLQHAKLMNLMLPSCFHSIKYTWLVFLLSKQAKSTFIKSSSNNILLSHHLCTSCNAAASEQPEWRKDRFTLQLLSKGRESFERHTLVKLWHSFSKMMETELDKPYRSSNPSICSISFPLKVKLPLPQPWYMTTFSPLGNVQRWDACFPQTIGP